ncbi:hypothetical protein BLNAU_2619 [Blattamonas nauphoetae]|uniref:EF-hand domain-containing protein n=1 Tax=Blattamonas nauphoetae TaxID=2049346 RepID=A0ABQ9YFH2_9EUKA|nr:hypothetical protein BLNAU_2619 [Blattamonas nauphoetae]
MSKDFPKYHDPAAKIAREANENAQKRAHPYFYRDAQMTPGEKGRKLPLHSDASVQRSFNGHDASEGQDENLETLTTFIDPSDRSGKSKPRSITSLSQQNPQVNQKLGKYLKQTTSRSLTNEQPLPLSPTSQIPANTFQQPNTSQQPQHSQAIFNQKLEDAHWRKSTFSDQLPATRTNLVQLLTELTEGLEEYASPTHAVERQNLLDRVSEEILRQVSLDSNTRGKILHTLLTEFKKDSSSIVSLSNSLVDAQNAIDAAEEQRKQQLLEKEADIKRILATIEVEANVSPSSEIGDISKMSKGELQMEVRSLLSKLNDLKNDARKAEIKVLESSEMKTFFEEENFKLMKSSGQAMKTILMLRTQLESTLRIVMEREENLAAAELEKNNLQSMILTREGEIADDIEEEVQMTLERIEKERLQKQRHVEINTNTDQLALSDLHGWIRRELNLGIGVDEETMTDRVLIDSAEERKKREQNIKDKADAEKALVALRADSAEQQVAALEAKIAEMRMSEDSKAKLDDANRMEKKEADLEILRLKRELEEETEKNKNIMTENNLLKKQLEATPNNQTEEEEQDNTEVNDRREEARQMMVDAIAKEDACKLWEERLQEKEEQITKERNALTDQDALLKEEALRLLTLKEQLEKQKRDLEESQGHQSPEPIKERRFEMEKQDSEDLSGEVQQKSQKNDELRNRIEELDAEYQQLCEREADLHKLIAAQQNTLSDIPTQTDSAISSSPGRLEGEPYDVNGVSFVDSGTATEAVIGQLLGNEPSPQILEDEPEGHPFEVTTKLRDLQQNAFASPFDTQDSHSFVLTDSSHALHPGLSMISPDQKILSHVSAQTKAQTPIQTLTVSTQYSGFAYSPLKSATPNRVDIAVWTTDSVTLNKMVDSQNFISTHNQEVQSDAQVRERSTLNVSRTPTPPKETPPMTHSISMNTELSVPPQADIDRTEWRWVESERWMQLVDPTVDNNVFIQAAELQSPDEMITSLRVDELVQKKKLAEDQSRAEEQRRLELEAGSGSTSDTAMNKSFLTQFGSPSQSASDCEATHLEAPSTTDNSSQTFSLLDETLSALLLTADRLVGFEADFAGHFLQHLSETGTPNKEDAESAMPFSTTQIMALSTSDTFKLQALILHLFKKITNLETQLLQPRDLFVEVDQEVEDDDDPEQETVLLEQSPHSRKSPKDTGPTLFSEDELPQASPKVSTAKSQKNPKPFTSSIRQKFAKTPGGVWVDPHVRAADPGGFANVFRSRKGTDTDTDVPQVHHPRFQTILNKTKTEGDHGGRIRPLVWLLRLIPLFYKDKQNHDLTSERNQAPRLPFPLFLKEWLHQHYGIKTLVRSMAYSVQMTSSAYRTDHAEISIFSNLLEGIYTNDHFSFLRVISSVVNVSGQLESMERKQIAGHGSETARQEGGYSTRTQRERAIERRELEEKLSEGNLSEKFISLRLAKMIAALFFYYLNDEDWNNLNDQISSASSGADEIRGKKRRDTNETADPQSSDRIKEGLLTSLQNMDNDTVEQDDKDGLSPQQLPEQEDHTKEYLSTVANNPVKPPTTPISLLQSSIDNFKEKEDFSSSSGGKHNPQPRRRKSLNVAATTTLQAQESALPLSTDRRIDHHTFIHTSQLVQCLMDAFHAGLERYNSFLASVFKSLDRDNDGMLSSEEWEVFVEQTCPSLGASSPITSRVLWMTAGRGMKEPGITLEIILQLSTQFAFFTRNVIANATLTENSPLSQISSTLSSLIIPFAYSDASLAVGTLFASNPAVPVYACRAACSKRKVVRERVLLGCGVIELMNVTGPNKKSVMMQIEGGFEERKGGQSGMLGRMRTKKGHDNPPHAQPQKSHQTTHQVTTSSAVTHSIFYRNPVILPSIAHVQNRNHLHMKEIVVVMQSHVLVCWTRFKSDFEDCHRLPVLSADQTIQTEWENTVSPLFSTIETRVEQPPQQSQKVDSIALVSFHMATMRKIWRLYFMLLRMQHKAVSKSLNQQEERDEESVHVEVVQHYASHIGEQTAMLNTILVSFNSLLSAIPDIR